MADAERKSRLVRNVALLVGGVALLALLGWLIRLLPSSDTPKTERQVQQVQIIRPPPPPPPPEELPPPPETEQEEIPEPIQDDIPSQDPSPSEQLGIDAEGAAGGDGFGLAARRGGSDLVGGSVFAWYSGIVRDAVVDCLMNSDSVRAKRFSIVVRLYVEPTGVVRSIERAASTGDAQLDRDLEAAMTCVRRLRDAPPLEMPQPITIRIVSRV